MRELKIHINKIGEDLVQCDNNCASIAKSLDKGIIPRCLYIEDKDRDGEKGCVIVGLNPGKSSKRESEMDYYKKNGFSYQSTIEYWELNLYNHPYYKFLRDFVTCLRLDGPILWTELIKCESDSNNGTLPLQTCRICTNKFLRKEMECVPSEWPLIAVSRESHKALSYLFPNKSVLGVPHPTSSRGNFSKLFIDKSRKKFTDDIQRQVDEFHKNPNIEKWLST